jgi:hypothetical protein
MGYLEKLEKNRDGFIEYCDCGKYLRQSDPQDFSGGKTIVVTPDECDECKVRAQEILEAQQIMGRLGLPKGEESNG